MIQTETISIPAVDDFSLAATRYEPQHNPTQTIAIINSATAVPRRFYTPFATFLAEQGYMVITYDYRGIGDSRPKSLRNFPAQARDWALKDMAAVLDWVHKGYLPKRLFFIGHSYGGQTAGLLPNSDKIDAMVAFSSQSGYWKLQGGSEKWTVAFHVHVTLPLLSHLLGYMPWSTFSKAEDLPKGVALEWSRWCRQAGYLLSDHTLPLDRFQQFTAPVLAYSFVDDDWGTARSVDAMMGAYQNLTREHITPAEIGVDAIGHFGAFRPKAQQLWNRAVQWLEETTPVPQTA